MQAPRPSGAPELIRDAAAAARSGGASFNLKVTRRCKRRAKRHPQCVRHRPTSATRLPMRIR
eukprot:3281947-Heterocapsa_arctica.AAC.1